MMFRQSRIAQTALVVSLATVATASIRFTPPPTQGMTFNMKVVLRQTPPSGRGRTITLLAHGQFAGGLGRVNIDTIDSPSTIRKGDVFIIRDSTRTFWARPSTMTVRQLSAPLINPLEGISERITSGTGSPRTIRVEFDTVSLDEMVNGYQTRHFRITADVVYPVGDRNVAQKVTIEHWLAKLPVKIMNPFSSRVRGLPATTPANTEYREFIRTLSAANRVFGEDVTVRTVTTTSYIYAPGLGEDTYQAVDLTDLKLAEIDERMFQLSADYKLQQVTRDSVAINSVTKKPPKKPPTT